MAVEKFTEHWESGVYICAECGNELFDSRAKFDAGTGWPNFRAAKPSAVHHQPDERLDLDRTAVICAECGHLLGNFWEDGIERGDTHPDAGERYCIESGAIEFSKSE